MKKKNQKRNFWKTIWGYVGDSRKSLIIAMLLSLIVGAFVAVKPILVKFIIDDGITNTSLSNIDRMKTAAFFCLAYIAAHILQMFSWGIAYRNLLKGLEEFMVKMRSAFFEHVQTLCMRFHDKNSSGELFNYIFGTPMTNLKNFLISLQYRYRSMLCLW